MNKLVVLCNEAFSSYYSIDSPVFLALLTFEPLITFLKKRVEIGTRYEVQPEHQDYTMVSNLILSCLDQRFEQDKETLSYFKSILESSFTTFRVVEIPESDEKYAFFFSDDTGEMLAPISKIPTISYYSL